MHLQSFQLKKLVNVSTICLKTLDILASDRGPPCSRIEQLKGKYDI